LPAWLTEAELQERFGEVRIDRLADRDGDSVPDEGAIESAILDAEGAGRAILAQRYEPDDLPTDPEDASRDLKRAAAQVAWYYLHVGKFDVVPEQVKEIRDAGLAWFRDAARGSLSLLLAGEPQVDQSRPVVLVSKRASSQGLRPMTLDDMSDWWAG
jgi:phage gp36-like protein